MPFQIFLIVPVRIVKIPRPRGPQQHKREPLRVRQVSCASGIFLLVTVTISYYLRICKLENTFYPLNLQPETGTRPQQQSSIVISQTTRVSFSPPVSMSLGIQTSLLQVFVRSTLPEVRCLDADRAELKGVDEYDW